MLYYLTHISRFCQVPESVSTNASDTFSVYPTIDSATGNLYMRTAQDRYGDVWLYISVLGNPEPAQRLLVSVLPVNDAPFFEPGDLYMRNVATKEG